MSEKEENKTQRGAKLAKHWNPQNANWDRLTPKSSQEIYLWYEHGPPRRGTETNSLRGQKITL